MLVFAFNRAVRPCVRMSLTAAEAGEQIFKIEIARTERFAAAVFVVEAAGLRASERIAACAAAVGVGQQFVVFSTLFTVG